MGGRGSSSGGAGGGGGGGGGGGSVNVKSSTSLISERERKQTEVDQTLSVLKDISDKYGVDFDDVIVATLQGRGKNSTIAFYDHGGHLGVNEKFFDSKFLNAAYDSDVASGFHPSRGNKSGLEAVVAHEAGHRLNAVAAEKAGMNYVGGMEAAATDIVRNAAKSAGYTSTRAFSSAISGYAQHNHKETIAESFADVYCNGKNARKESQAVVSELNKYFGQ